jgi:sec-independent protein translocase protein TatA
MSLHLHALALLDGLGGGELMVVFFLALMLFGGEKLPGLARSLGKMMNEFKRAKGDMEREIRRAIDETPDTSLPKRPAAQVYQPYGDTSAPSPEPLAAQPPAPADAVGPAPAAPGAADTRTAGPEAGKPASPPA